jgi:hypothetical protein
VAVDELDEFFNLRLPRDFETCNPLRWRMAVVAVLDSPTCFGFRGTGTISVSLVAYCDVIGALGTNLVVILGSTVAGGFSQEVVTNASLHPETIINIISVYCNMAISVLPILSYRQKGQLR